MLPHTTSPKKVITCLSHEVSSTQVRRIPSAVNLASAPAAARIGTAWVLKAPCGSAYSRLHEKRTVVRFGYRYAIEGRIGGRRDRNVSPRYGLRATVVRE